MVKINWSTVLQRCQPQARQKIIDLRSRHEDLTRQMVELKASLPVIDWSMYREQLGAEAGKHVDVLEAKAKQFKPAVQDYQPALALIEKEKDEKMSEARVYLENLEADIVTLKDYLTGLETLKDVDNLTIDDFFKVRPDMKEHLDSEFEKDHWGVAPEPASRDAH